MNVGVIGGGAAGSIAALTLAEGGANVFLFEKNEKLGKKLYITGKGRCNLTNACSPDEFFKHVVHGQKFLRSAIYSFAPSDAMALFERLGVPLKVERGNRVFPMSDKSSDIIRALESALKRAKVNLKLNCAVNNINKNGNAYKIIAADGSYDFDAVIVATGGISYPSTGSTGDGYDFAKRFGLDVVEPRQSLVQIMTEQSVASLEGISLKNVTLTAYDENGKQIASEFGEMLFTSKGLSGPIALTISAYINRLSRVALCLNLKPALTSKQLDARILRDFEERKNQELKNVTRALLPERLNSYVLKSARIDENKQANSVTKDERKRLVETLQALRFDMSGLGGFSEAVVTSGGVELSQLKPSCECIDAKNLYFVGETIDVDALTGGFNLQLAFATGMAAAKDILKKYRKAVEE